MSKKRKTYSSEEKAQIVMELLKNELTQSQITSKYGIHATQLHNWKKQFKEGVVNIFRDKKQKDTADKDELIEELYKQIGQQKVELDWLKKKSELFS